MTKAKQKLKDVRNFVNSALKGRPKPSAPRLGVKKSGSRYDSGGKVTRKKNV